ncbi:hypothetical protein [Hymenobacter crusticola]|uniref:Uncharacterized protein n=1 Tax=Hymenobacter crusticola TaxID=1770526 RepID=A0A243W7Q7_9BACT|nr:hypothetical protein [Hymenobacter crusticola]OUJ68586.1 hypothetical protein BXP70_27890 [Hymenobacter crusticola]
MTSLWFVRLTLPSHSLGLRLLVLVLSLAWLVATSGSVYLLLYMARRVGSLGIPTAWLTGGAVFLIAMAGYAALVRAYRWTGVPLLLAACGLGAYLLYWTFWMAFVLGLLYHR